MSAASQQDLWFISRGTGMVCLLLMTLSLVIGIVVHRRGGTEANSRVEQSSMVVWHRNISLISLLFLAVHIVSALVDPYVSIGIFATVVPFISPYETLWMGLGAIATDLILVVIASSLLRRHIGQRLWLAIHLTTYACWPIAVAHGIGSSPDLQSGVQLAIAVGACLAVVAAALWRLRGLQLTPARAARVSLEMGR